MFTFVFVASLAADDAVNACRAALERLRATLPNLGSPGRIAVSVLPELPGACGTLLPAAYGSPLPDHQPPEGQRLPALLQLEQNDRVFTVSYGERARTPALARALSEVFEREGAAGVAALDGNFSALIVERESRSVWLCGTLLGHRALHYARAGEAFIASPHDLALLATGLVPLELEPVSAASMLVCDWSLSGRPLLAGARRCHPLELVRWQGGRLELRRHASAWPARRLDRGDRRGIECQVGLVADELERTAREATAGLDRIEGALTAGLDSRALWGALVAAAQGRPLLATTSGGEQSLDVRVARQLAHGFGAEHTRREVDVPTAADFARLLELMAFFANGDTNGKRALARLPRLSPPAQPFAGGTGGEIFRGFFYPYLGVPGTSELSLEALSDKLLRWRFRRFADVRFRDPGLRGALRSRLRETLEFLSEGSDRAHDVLDLFYLFERYGRWGARPACYPWNATWTPFESVGAIRAALALPTPVGQHCAVHELLIRRHLPRRAYWTPINGSQLVPLQGPGRARHLLRQGLALRGLALQKLQKLRRGSQAGSATPDQQRARFLAEDLRDAVRGMLSAQDSLSRQLLGADGVDRLLTQHEQRRDQLPLLGILLTAEQWLSLARRLQG